MPRASPWNNRVDCPPLTGIVSRQDGLDGAAVVIRQDGPLPPRSCPRCGRAGELEEVEELVVRSREEVARALAEAGLDEGS